MNIQDNWRWCNKCQELTFAGNATPGRCAAGGLHDHAGSGKYQLLVFSQGTPGQHNWRWCNKCQGLFFTGSASPGHCPAGGLHDFGGSWEYTLLVVGSSVIGGGYGQNNWRYCSKCQGLGFGGSGDLGHCPEGGAHDYRSSSDYVLLATPDDASPQSEWRWCNKCEGMFYSGGGVLGHCPAGDQHDATGSGNYVLIMGSADSSSQDNWRWCNKCQGLAFAGNTTPGRCPAGDQHDHTGSANYVLATQSNFVGQDNWRWCNKCQGLAFAGRSTAGNCPAGGQHDHTGSGDYILQLVSGPPPLQQFFAHPDGPRRIGVSCTLFALEVDSISSIEVWEDTGPFADRHVATLTPSNEQAIVDETGDIFAGLTHCFSPYTVNTIGRSFKGIRACSATGADAPPSTGGPPPPTPTARTQFQTILSGDWERFITPAPGEIYVAVAPPGTDPARAPHHQLNRDVSVGGWSASIPASAGPSGPWQFSCHIRGQWGDGSDTGDHWSPLYSCDWGVRGLAATFTCDSMGTGDFEWSPTATCLTE